MMDILFQNSKTEYPKSVICVPWIIKIITIKSLKVLKIISSETLVAFVSKSKMRYSDTATFQVVTRISMKIMQARRLDMV